MTRREGLMKKKMNNNQCSPMSNSTWCNFNDKGDILKINDFLISLNVNVKSKLPLLQDNFKSKVVVLKIQ